MKRFAKSRMVGRLASTLALGAVAGLYLVTTNTLGGPATHAATQAMDPAAPHHHHDSRHMHMKNWALEPTGIAGVTPLDPTTIPKWKNQLTEPPVLVPVGTRHDPQTGKDLPLYVVTAKAVRQQMLPPGFPTTKVFAYGGKVNFAEAGQTPDVRTAFTVPGPTFEAVRDHRIFVRYRNDIRESHLFPVDPTLMVANPNNAPTPTPPFKPFPPVTLTVLAPVFMSAPMTSIRRSVWSRDKPGSVTVVTPSAYKPARSRADFICALATGVLYSIAFRPVPCIAKGSFRPSSRPVIRAPIARNGSVTRPIGRSFRLSSPLKQEKKF